MILIGSRAMIHHIPDCRQAQDWDFIMPLLEIYKFSVDHRQHIKFMWAKNQWKFCGQLVTGECFEIEVCDYNPSSQKLWQMRHEFQQVDVNLLGGFGNIPLQVYVPSLNYLCAIKRSHLYWNVHWHKNISDYHLIKSVLGLSTCDMPHVNDEFYNLRLAENQAKWGKTQANLNMTNSEFFNKSKIIGRKFNHDDLHQAVKYYQVPVYEMAKVNKSLATVDRNMFYQMHSVQRNRAVREEAMVIALERKIIPGISKLVNYDAQWAYSYGLRRLCTNLSSGWFRDHAIENWDQLKTMDVNYVDKFLNYFNIKA